MNQTTRGLIIGLVGLFAGASASQLVDWPTAPGGRRGGPRLPRPLGRHAASPMTVERAGPGLRRHHRPWSADPAFGTAVVVYLGPAGGGGLPPGTSSG